MSRAFDVSKFRKSITKSVKGLSVGFHDVSDWISTGNYTLNKLISNDFHKGVPLGRVTMFAGESGSGKSFLAAGNIVKNAQDQGIFIVLIDSESALDSDWLHALGVDTSEDKLLKLNMAMIDEVAKVISEFVAEYRSNYQDETNENRPKVLFVIDSLGMLMSPTETDQFQRGDLRGDFGRKSKQLKALVTNCVNMFSDLNIGLVATNHTYESQSLFDPDQVISGGAGMIFASSIVVAIRKLKLKEDEDGNKISQVKGIRAACKVVKTRYAKPFETVQIKIPYSTGMQPHSGLTDFFESTGIITKTGNKLEFTSKKTGEYFKLFRKGWERNDKGCLDVVMDEFDDFVNERELAAIEAERVEVHSDSDAAETDVIE